MFKVELFEPRLTHLAQPCAGQQAHPDDLGGALILGRIQCLGQLRDFLLATGTARGRLHAFREARRGIVRAPSPS